MPTGATPTKLAFCKAQKKTTMIVIILVINYCNYRSILITNYHNYYNIHIIYYYNIVITVCFSFIVLIIK